MINALCKIITERIRTQTCQTYEQAEIINYGLQILLFEFLSSIAVLSISISFGILQYVFVVTTVFGLLRVTGGGAHGRSRFECLAGYVVFIFVTIFLSKRIVIDIYVMVLLFIVNTVIFAVFAPGDTQEKPITKREKRIKLKAFSVPLLLMLFIVAFLIKSMEPIVCNIIILSSTYAAFLLSPLGYKLTGCKHGYFNF